MPNSDTKTEGGAYIEGSVLTGGGTFVGRDYINIKHHNIFTKTVIERINRRPSLLYWGLLFALIGLYVSSWIVTSEAGFTTDFTKPLDGLFYRLSSHNLGLSSSPEPLREVPQPLFTLISPTNTVEPTITPTPELAISPPTTESTATFTPEPTFTFTPTTTPTSVPTCQTITDDLLLKDRPHSQEAGLVLATFSRGAILLPVAKNPEGTWLKVNTQEDIQGWILLNDEWVNCSNLPNDLQIEEGPPALPTNTPIPTPTATTAPILPPTATPPIQPETNPNVGGTPVENCTLQVSGHSSVLKVEPSSGSLSTGSLPSGTYTAQRRSGNWFYIVSNGQSGWVDGFWATVSPACADEFNTSQSLGTPIENCTLQVSGQSSVLKVEPGSGSLSTGSLPSGTYSAQRRSGNWFYIVNNGQSGWVDGFWATVSPACAN